MAIRDDSGKALYLLTVLEDVTENRRSEQRISHMAHHDTLTDLPNRAAFNEYFSATLAKAAKGERFVILSIDLNRFKETNDVYGHSAGDLLLQEVATACRLPRTAHSLRASAVTNSPSSSPMALSQRRVPRTDRLLAAFVDDFVIEDKHGQIGLSIGGAIYPNDGKDAKSLMVNADAALYRAKAEPHPSVVFFREEMGVELQERHNLQRDLRLAIDLGEMSLHYQPQFLVTTSNRL